MACWWFQPIWKILVKLDHFLKYGWKKKYLKPPPRWRTYLKITNRFSIICDHSTQPAWYETITLRSFLLSKCGAANRPFFSGMASENDETSLNPWSSQEADRENSLGKNTHEISNVSWGITNFLLCSKHNWWWDYFGPSGLWKRHLFNCCKMKGKPNKKVLEGFRTCLQWKDAEHLFFGFVWVLGGGHCRFKSKRQASPTLIKMWYRIVSKHPKVTLLNFKKHLLLPKKIQKEHRKLARILALHLFWQIPWSINEFLPHDQSAARDFCSSKLRGRWTT